jgi:Omp85 superfamily domain
MLAFFSRQGLSARFSTVVVAWLLLCLAFPVGTGKAASDAQPAADWWQLFDPRTSPIIPIPEVGTDPNGGTTVGVLPVYLVKDSRGEITEIIAPDVTYNQYLGYGGHARVLAYPSGDTQWSVELKAKEHIERGANFRYATGLSRATPWSYSVHLQYDRSATERFFGIGNDTSQDAQTNYTNEQVLLDATLGWNLSPALQLGWTLRPHYVAIEPGAIPSLPFIRQSFPNLPGVSTDHEFFNRLYVSYDTRDSVSLPTKGSQAVVSAGATDSSFLSSTSYAVLGVDVRHYQPVSDRVIVAGHVALRYMPEANDAPFWALSSLGGDRSVPSEEQPLRGFGEDRFIDRNLSSGGVEVRTRVLDLDVFATAVSLEVAPFVEAGSVFHSLSDSPVRDLHAVGGVGFRAIARPSILGYVDVGYGSEGAAIFSGINYPF